MYNFEYLRGLKELREFINKANTKGYTIVCVTQNDSSFTIFYK